ncbi:MAG: hypothetical protein M3N16_08065 [Actinomycetota bacterium]|nr:hypothetical protein [Actinomycetota bacterium]
MPPGVVVEEEIADAIAQVVAGYLVEEDDILHRVSFELEGAHGGERLAVEGAFEPQGIPELLSALLEAEGELARHTPEGFVDDERPGGRPATQAPIDCGDYASPWCHAGGDVPSEVVSFCAECGVLAELVYPGGLCIHCAEDPPPPASL